MKLKKFDAAEYIETPEDVVEFLSAAFESGDAGHIANALGIVARSRGMSQIAEAAGVTRAALYKGFDASGDPKLSTILGVLRALGLQISLAPATPAEAA